MKRLVSTTICCPSFLSYRPTPFLITIFIIFLSNVYSIFIVSFFLDWKLPDSRILLFLFPAISFSLCYSCGFVQLEQSHFLESVPQWRRDGLLQLTESRDSEMLSKISIQEVLPPEKIQACITWSFWAPSVTTSCIFIQNE